MKKINLENLSNKRGFTLAETLITLTILGVVAAITIPALINRQQEAANRTKLKKAMTVYEKALNNMIIENDLKTNQSIIDFGAEGGACANTTTYFKKVEGDGCRFKTADRIWWDISDIQNPLIILNDKKKDEEIATLQGLAKDTNDITTYGFVGKIDDEKSIIRINDNSYKPGANDEGYLTKLYGFVNPNKAADSGTPTSKQGEFMSQKCTKNNDDTYTCEGSEAKFFGFKFTDEETTLPCYDSNWNWGEFDNCPKSKSDITDDTVVTMVQPGISWNDAQSACPSGTHLAKAAELKQLWNNGAEGNVLESLCDNCSRNDYALFWAAEEGPNFAYLFGTYYGGFDYSTKVNDISSSRVVCVGN